MSQKKVKAKSYARITLALDIIKKNTTGSYICFHELGIIKHQINLFDEIEISDSIEMKILCDDLDVPVDRNNICWQVVDLLKEHFKIRRNVLIKIKKNIPAQGGLAGGSSNAATTFKLLNKLWQLNLSVEELVELSREIGMDVPYFFIGATVFDSESGEVLRVIPTEIKFNFVIALPEFGVSTVDAYKQIDYNKIAQQKKFTVAMEKAFISGRVDNIGHLMHNDFELTVFQKKPELKVIKQKMLEAGSSNVVMSGSGSSMVGLVKNEAEAGVVCQKLRGFKVIKVKSFYE